MDNLFRDLRFLIDLRDTITDNSNITFITETDYDTIEKFLLQDKISYDFLKQYFDHILEEKKKG